MKKTILLFFITLISLGVYSLEIIPNGDYKIIGIRHFSDGKTAYSKAFDKGLNYLMVKDNIITITINEYLVDMLSTKESKKISSKDEVDLYTTYSLLDEVEKTVLIKKAEGNAFMFFLNRGKSSSDIFIIMQE